MLTLLQIVQSFARRQGIRVPSAVTTSTDETILQIWGLLDEEVTELADRREWLWLRGQSSFNHLNGAGYLAYALNTLPDYKGIVPRTLFSDDSRLPVAGPASDEQWAVMMALSVAPSLYTYRSYGGNLYIYPAPSTPASVLFSFEYYSSYPVASSGGIAKALFTADTDVPRLPDRIVMAGLRWRWKKEKNQPYAEEMRAYEAMLEAEAGRESIPTDIHLDNPDPENATLAPVIVIPAGNWNV